MPRGTTLLAILVLMCAGAVSAMGETGNKLIALVAALAFPTLACLQIPIWSEAASWTSLKPSDAAKLAVLGILRSSLVTALGILSVIGLLASRDFMVKLSQFPGIKAAHVVPVLVIAVAVIAGMPRSEASWAEQLQGIKSKFASFLGEPVRVGTLILGLIAIVGLSLVVARTGNEPGVGVSGAELKFRALLDALLPVRPRTKEFLLGHPAFVLALALWFRGRRKWTFPLFLVGVLGQVSLLNTFCHIHTPLYLSLVRDVTGLVFGICIGLILFALTERWSRGDNGQQRAVV